MDSTSELAGKIMLLLSEYKYLTKQQMQRLIYKSVGKKEYEPIRKATATLLEKGFEYRIIYGAGSGVGSNHQIHHLTDKGAKALARNERIDLEDINYPKSTEPFLKTDFFHRIYCVDFQIALNQWLEKKNQELDFLDRYLDHVGSQRNQSKGHLQPKSLVQLDNGSITPDIIFGYDGKLFMYDMLNGADAKLAMKKIRLYAYGAYTGAVTDKYIKNEKNKSMPKMLYQFENEGLMKSVIERIKKDAYLSEFDGLDKYLYFSLRDKVFGQWVSLHGERVTLFEK